MIGTQTGSCRVVGRADVEELAALPHHRWYRVEVWDETSASLKVHEIRAGTSHEGSPFIDLVERIRHGDERIRTAVDCALSEREKCFARSADRQYVLVRIDRRGRQ